MTVTTELTALEGSPAVVQSGRPVYRWVILLFAWACYLMSSVDRFAWSSLSLQAQPELGLPLAQLATFVTAYFAGYVASNCISGVMTDRLGPHWHWHFYGGLRIYAFLLGGSGAAMRNGFCNWG